jgi:hypothetical protein
MTDDEEARKIGYAETALELALMRVLEARGTRRGRPQPEGQIDPEGKIIQPILTVDEARMRCLANTVTHSEESALLTLHWIGQQLHEMGGTDLMEKALKAATELHSEEEYGA